VIMIPLIKPKKGFMRFIKIRSGRPPGRAIEKGFGKAPVFNREGGSIPVVSTFQEELGLPSVLFGVGLPDENAHAPNEKLDLSNFHNGIIASAYLYDEIANLE
jgi:acetylornithine deacetylase/succinyl-diaminopimelate desuccinylase-like protein